MKFITEKKCWHNGKYYEEGDTVECNCSQCKEGKVSYFTKIEDTKEEVKVEVKEEKIEVPKKRNKLVITD